VSRCYSDLRTTTVKRIIILAFAGPVLNPQDRTAGQGAVLIVTDGSWASARDWARRVDRIETALLDAARDGRTAALVSLTDLPPEGPIFQDAQAVSQSLAGLEPNAFAPNVDTIETWSETLNGSFDTFWMSDGLQRDSREILQNALENHGTVTVFESPRPVFGLRTAQIVEGDVTVPVLRAVSGTETQMMVTAIGLDPAGTERRLSTAPATFDATATQTTATFDLPPELRNRITRFELQGIQSAGAVALTDDALKRREVALIAPTGASETLDLLSPLHYLEQALIPTADLIDGTLEDVLLANPDVIVLSDIATLTANYS